MSPTLDLIVLVVDDMGTSLAFYRELGLEIPPDALIDDPDGNDVSLFAPLSG